MKEEQRGGNLPRKPPLKWQLVVFWTAALRPWVGGLSVASYRWLDRHTQADKHGHGCLNKHFQVNLDKCMHLGFLCCFVAVLTFWCKCKLLPCVLKFGRRSWKLKKIFLWSRTFVLQSIDSETKCESVRDKWSWNSLPQRESHQARNTTRYVDDDDDDDDFYLVIVIMLITSTSGVKNGATVLVPVILTNIYQFSSFLLADSAVNLY